MNELLEKLKHGVDDFDNFKSAYFYFLKSLKRYSKESSFRMIGSFVSAQMQVSSGIEKISEFSRIYGIFPWNFERLISLIYVSEQDNLSHRKDISLCNKEFKRLLRKFNDTMCITFKGNYSPANILALLLDNQIKYQENLLFKLFLYDNLFNQSAELRGKYEIKYGQQFHLTIIYLFLMIGYVNVFYPEKSSQIVMNLLNKNKNLFDDSKIELNDLIEEQKNILVKWDYDFINCPIVIEWKPIIVDNNNYYLTSVMNLVESTYNGYINSLTKGGNENGNIVGKAYEKLFHFYFLNYKFKDEKNIGMNVLYNKKELFDIVISKGEYLLGIDSKSFIIFSGAHTIDKSKVALNELVDKVIQRIKVIDFIKNNKISFFGKDFNIENIFSIIAVRDNCNIFKQEYLDLVKDRLGKLHLENYYDYVNKNLIVVSHVELLQLIIDNVDIIQEMKSMKEENRYLNAFRPSNRNPDKENMFTSWKENIIKEIETLIKTGKLE